MTRAQESEGIVPLDGYAGLVDAYREAKANGDLWRERELELRGQMLALIGDHDVGTLDDQWVIRHVVSKGRTTINGEQLKAKYPEVYREVVKTGRPIHSLRFL